MKERELLGDGIGRKLIFLGRAADMISVSLSSTAECQYNYAIHIMADGAIYYQGHLLTNTEEIYTPGEPDIAAKFDQKVTMLMDLGKEFVLQDIYYDSDRCLFLSFSNQLEIRSFPEKDCFDTEDELWRVFFPWRAEPCLVARHSGICLEQCDCSQDELDPIRIALKKRTLNNRGTLKA